MTLNRRKRRSLIRRRDELHGRLLMSIVLASGGLFLSRLGPCVFVWKRSERTGRPRLISTWNNYYPAMRSMARAVNVAARARYWDVRNAHR